MVNRRQISGVIRIQFAITALLGMLLALIVDTNSAWSAVCGAAVAVLGALVYAMIAFRAGFWAPSALLRFHFAAEMAKLGVTLLAFAVVFIFYRQVAALWVFIGYLAAASAYWFGLLFKFDGKK